MTKLIYNYNPKTGRYTGTSYAEVDPMVAKVVAERARRLAEQKANASFVEAGGALDKVPFPKALDPLDIPPIELSYLMPAFSTEIAPPEAVDGMVALFSDGSWKLVHEQVEAASNLTLDTGKFTSIEQVERAVQQLLDAQARMLGYRDISSAVSYAEEKAVPKYQAEGKALRKWRSLTWSKLYELLDELKSTPLTDWPLGGVLLSKLPAFKLD